MPAWTRAGNKVHAIRTVTSPVQSVLLLCRTGSLWEAGESKMKCVTPKRTLLQPAVFAAARLDGCSEDSEAPSLVCSA